MLKPQNTTTEILNPITRDYRASFLIAIQKCAPSVLRDLESIYLKRLSGSALERALSAWAQRHNLYPWVLAIAQQTIKRWERQPNMSRTTWKLPVQVAAAWDAVPFSFSHRGYMPHIDGNLRAHIATLRRDLERSLASYTGRIQDAKDAYVSKQPGQTLHIQKRSRDGRDKYVAFEWLAMSIEPGTNLTRIAKKAKVDRAAVAKQINWAKSVLSV